MNKIIIFFVLLMFHSTALVAESIATSTAETQLTLSPSLLHFDYTEFSTTDKVLDSESGWLPGIEAKLSHSITLDWSFDITSAYYSGAVDYTGQTQSGVSLSTSTDTNLFRFGGQINKIIYKKVYLFVGAQFRQWDRDIKSTNTASGIDETYKWIEYSIGLYSDIYSNKNNVVSVDVAYLLIRNATVEADLSRVNLGTTTLDIADGTGARANLNWKILSADKINYGLSLFAEGWDFGRSNTKRTQGGSPNVLVTEPRSETRNIGLKFNIEYNF